MPTLAPIALEHTGSDPYQWLQHPDSDETTAYLAAESAWFNHSMRTTQALQQQLFDEIKARYHDTDLSLAMPRGGWLYYFRKHEGETYRRYYRCRQADEARLDIDAASETLLLDPNVMAGGGDITFGALSSSPDQHWLGYSLWSTAATGIFLRNLTSDEQRHVPLPAGEDFDGSLVWANDSNTVLFATRNDQHSNRLYRYQVGETTPTLVFEEHDPQLTLNCSRSASGQWLLIECSGSHANETWAIPAHQPQAPAVCLKPRTEPFRAMLDHGHWDGSGHWFMLSDRAGNQLSIDYASDSGASALAWASLLPARAGVTIEHVTLNQHAVVLSLRQDGDAALEIHRAGTAPVRVEAPQALCEITPQQHLPYHSEGLIIRLESFTLPRQLCRLDLTTGRYQVVNAQQVVGNFDSTRYVTTRHWATSADGTRVPLSVVVRSDHANRPVPMLLKVYGAYGLTETPAFSHAQLSLLDRGFAIAIAHVRGGGFLGYAWYQQGRGALQNNRIEDFLACSRYVIDSGLTLPSGLVIQGHSAGGGIVGAALNAAPELFAAAIALQPFVDPLTAMLDPDLPLTTLEYGEWGDPRQPEAFAWLKAWAPYHNVRPQAYPPVLASATLDDRQVPYWQPAKWLAALRANDTTGNLMLLQIRATGGHGLPKGRYEKIRQFALEYAFIFSALGLAGRTTGG